MTQIAFPSCPVPLSLELGSMLQLSDDELLDLCVRNKELRIERTAEGDLIVMPPAGGATSHRNVCITSALLQWANREGSWLASGSSAGFVLPNRAMRSPDAGCVLRSRVELLAQAVREKFLPLCPDFVVELRSLSDRLSVVLAKMEEYRDNGARLGWLIDPTERRVHVYRPGRTIEVLHDPAEVSGDPELPGFVLDLEPIWKPF